MARQLPQSQRAEPGSRAQGARAIRLSTEMKIWELAKRGDEPHFCVEYRRVRLTRLDGKRNRYRLSEGFQHGIRGAQGGDLFLAGVGLDVHRYMDCSKTGSALRGSTDDGLQVEIAFDFTFDFLQRHAGESGSVSNRRRHRRGQSDEEFFHRARSAVLAQ